MTNTDGLVVTNSDTRIRIADEVRLGKRVVVGPNCRSVEIGFGSVLGDDLYIDVPEFTMGEYTTIHRGTTIHGYEPCSIGHNCWIGQYCIIDSIGGTRIGNNVGVGAQSQLWTHIKFGDTLAGCRWNSVGPLVVEDDVWFVGHCIVSPITARERSMLMVGGVATRDMEPNRIYAGAPAKDMTDKLGTQFEDVPIEDRVQRLQNLHQEFLSLHSWSQSDFDIKITEDLSGESGGERVTVFNVRDRAYKPTRSAGEVGFIRFMLYERAKFVPSS